MDSVYLNCPVFQTKRFLIRNIKIEDAEDLLCCYSDLKAAELFNCDNCTSNFIFTTLEEMQDCISFWLDEYKRQYYVRFAIVDIDKKKAIGTMEIYNKGSFEHLKNVGILRLDLCSEYETEDCLDELLEMASEHLYKVLGLENIMTKAAPKAETRIKALNKHHYLPVLHQTVMPFADYYIRNIVTPDEVADSIGYCGLVCRFCHEAESCGGCKSQVNCCASHLSEANCYQFNCCVEKGIRGCWECEIAPCNKDMFSEDHDIRNQTFVKCAKEEGLAKLARYVLTNQLNGIRYGWNKDYDNLGSEEAVLDLLHKGVESLYSKHSS